MQFLVLLMMMGLLLHDTSGWAIPPRLHGTELILAANLPFGVLALLGWLGCRWAMKRIDTRPSSVTRTLDRLDLWLAIVRWTTVAGFFANIYLLGWLDWLQVRTGHAVLLGDLALLVPALGVPVLTWWAYYPIDRRMREATLMRSLDTAQPVAAIWSRGQYLLSQLRHNVLLLTLPLLVILGWMEALELWAKHSVFIADYEGWFAAGGALAIFALAPLGVKLALDVVPLPHGPLRDRLLVLCTRYHISVRQLLLWRTYGGVINGAVMGLFGRVRFILLTDGLLDRLTDGEIEAVMAHELGHVKRRHMVWMAVCAIAALAVSALILRLAIPDALADRILHLTGTEAGVDAVVMIGSLMIWGVLFGFISRRFERQADTFAVQHLSRSYPDPTLGPDVIHPAAIEVVSSALRRVAMLNHIPLDRPSWRHGSMGWRIGYLQTLAGRPVDGVPIDRTIRRIRWACVVALAAVALQEYAHKM